VLFVGGGVSDERCMVHRNGVWWRYTVSGRCVWFIIWRVM